MEKSTKEILIVGGALTTSALAFLYLYHKMQRQQSEQQDLSANQSGYSIPALGDLGGLNGVASVNPNNAAAFQQLLDNLTGSGGGSTSMPVPPSTDNPTSPITGGSVSVTSGQLSSSTQSPTPTTTTTTTTTYSGGGGSGCFTPNVAVKTGDAKFVKFSDLAGMVVIENETGRHTAQLLIHDVKDCQMIEFIPGKFVTLDHLMKDGQSWVRAELFYYGKPRIQYTGKVYNLHVNTTDDRDRHFILENGDVAHNLKAYN